MDSRSSPAVSSASFSMQIQTDDGLLLENTLLISTVYQPQRPANYLIKLVAQDQTLTQPAAYYPVAFSNQLGENQLQLSTQLKMQYGYHARQFYRVELNRIHLTPPIQQVQFIIQRLIPHEPNASYEIDGLAFTQLIKNRLREYPLVMGQLLYFPYDKTHSIELLVDKINPNALSDNTSEMVFSLRDDSRMNLRLGFFAANIDLKQPEIQINQLVEEEAIAANIPPVEEFENTLPSEFSLDFKAQGIGGLDAELTEIAEKVFYPHALPPHLRQCYGIQPTRGMLIYGPPGTGKTLIARKIASKFSNENVTFISATQTENSFVGQSAANLRDLFRKARLEWLNKGENSALHVFIFDEIDVLCPRRGSRSDGTGTSEKNVATLLTEIDGIDSPGNILVIGITNRIDALDEALLRPGRLGLHIKINLPNQIARAEILTIKLQQMSQHGLLKDDVDIAVLAELSENFTGAELEELVKNAACSCMGNNLDITDKIIKKEFIHSAEQLEKVAQADLLKALHAIIPAFGIQKNSLRMANNAFAIYQPELMQVITDFSFAVTALKNNPKLVNFNYLIAGDSKVGKTALANYLATQTNARYVHMLRTEQFIHLKPYEQINLLEEEFNNASQAPFSIIILDDLENILQADAKYTTYDNQLRLTLSMCLQKLTYASNKAMVIATTRSKNFLKEIQLFDQFDETCELKPIHLQPLNSLASYQILQSICEKLHCSVRASQVPRHQVDGRVIELSIGRLIQSIKKFIAQDRHQAVLDIDGFYLALIQSRAQVANLVKFRVGDKKAANENNRFAASMAKLTL